MPQAGFEPAIRASERPKIHALDRAATGIGSIYAYVSQIFSCLDVFKLNLVCMSHVPHAPFRTCALSTKTSGLKQVVVQDDECL